MKLWLDDERSPKDPYIQEWFGAVGDEVWVKTANDAIHLLKTGQVVYISFDHDLGNGAGDGSQVADWIEEQAFNGNIPRLEWAVHSKNQVGAKAITAAMMNADRFWDKHEKT